MKRKLINVLGITSTGFGILLALVAFILLVTGEMKGAALFATPAFALLLAGSNLKTYAEE